LEDENAKAAEQSPIPTETEMLPVDDTRVRSAMETDLPEDDEGKDESGEFISIEEIQGQLPNIIEALLFASDEPLAAQTVKDILRVDIDARALRGIILDINKRLQTDRRPFEIVEVAGGFQYRTIVTYQKYLKGLFKDKAMRRLSGQALETLAIIAYKQPVSKAEVESIRNVSTDSALKTLLEKRLIKILGKSEEKPGKPIVYGTTRDFLRYFGLNRISDLPKIEEFEDIARSQEKNDIIMDFKREADSNATLSPTEYHVATDAEPDAPPVATETPEAPEIADEIIDGDIPQNP